MPPTILLIAETEFAWSILQFAIDTLNDFGVPSRKTSHEMIADIIAGETAGAELCIAGITGGQPDFLQQLAGKLQCPVLAVPVPSDTFEPLAVLQHCASSGQPAATLAIGKAGAINAALLAISVLANTDDALLQKLEAFRANQTQNVLAGSIA